jgi:hypothetical protein
LKPKSVTKFSISANPQQPMNEPQQPLQINIEVDDKTAEGVYSNFAIINHSPAEFILDFTTLLPGMQRAKVHSRIIMTPQHAKSLLVALQDNIAKYEGAFGTIKFSDVQANPAPMGFRVEDKQKLS